MKSKKSETPRAIFKADLYANRIKNDIRFYDGSEYPLVIFYKGIDGDYKPDTEGFRPVESKLCPGDIPPVDCGLVDPSDFIVCTPNQMENAKLANGMRLGQKPNADMLMQWAKENFGTPADRNVFKRENKMELA